MSTQRFSASILNTKVKLYQSTREDYALHKDVLDTIVKNDNENEKNYVMMKTSVEEEITLFIYYDDEDAKNKFVHMILEQYMKSDPRIYHIINIHEDIPGIDHIGIISTISRLFSKREIPILYVNTYSYNLVLVSEECKIRALEVLGEISYLE